MHPLENPIWQALTIRQTEFAQSCGEARRFVPEVSPLAAFAGPDDKGYADLAALTAVGGSVAVFIESPYQAQPDWQVIAQAPLVQMVQDGVASKPVRQSTESLAPLVKLGVSDSVEMVALAALTKPGPFLSRTHELGNYVGIRCEGNLVAMAGERLKLPGYTEVSAVCTRPEHTGKGYAALLMGEVMRGIRDRGEIPILHTRQDNVRANDLYRRLGFRDRWLGHFAVLRRA